MSKLIVFLAFLFITPFILFLGYNTALLPNSKMANESLAQFRSINTSMQQASGQVATTINVPILGTLTFDSVLGAFLGVFQLILTIIAMPITLFNITDLPLEIKWGFGALISGLFAFTLISWYKGQSE